jgi:3-hydroxyisobutyrate dehydrogenase
MRVGFVGCGVQGLPVAQRLARAGFPLTVWARRPEQVAGFAPEQVASSLAELGARSDVLGVCVYDADDVREVVRAAAPTMPVGGVVMVHSTIAPADVEALAAELAADGLRVVDAPVSGGPRAAAEGTLTVALGGAPADLDRVAPVLAAYAGTAVRLGGLGAGQRAKLLNNALCDAQLRLATDALDLGEGIGLDRDALATVLRTGSGRSFALETVLARPLEVLATTRSRTTITKDVDLARAEVGPDSALIGVATRLCRDLDRIHAGAR